MPISNHLIDRARRSLLTGAAPLLSAVAPNEARHDPLEAGLASFPTITLEGNANGAPHPEPAADARMFTGRYEHRLITGGIGHNLPQEAPLAVTQALLDLARA